MPDQPDKPSPAAEQHPGKTPTPTTASRDKAEAPKNLTPAEQMALYEDDLKESDWGHQPC